MTAEKNAGGVIALACAGLALFIPVEAVVPPLNIDAAIDRAADRQGIPRRLFHALVQVESAKRPDAVSHKGAIGLSQVMPFNAARCGLPHAVYLRDPMLNLDCGAQILREELDRIGNVRGALAVYNCGKPDCKAGLKYASTVLAKAGKG